MKKISTFLVASLAMFLLFGCGGGTVQPDMKTAELLVNLEREPSSLRSA